MHPVLVHPYFRQKRVRLDEYTSLTLVLNRVTSIVGSNRVDGLVASWPIFDSMGGPTPYRVYSLEAIAPYIGRVIDLILDDRKVIFNGGNASKLELYRLVGSALVQVGPVHGDISVETHDGQWTYGS